MSGYDIKQFLDHFAWLVSGPSYGSIYPALHALHQDGLLCIQECASTHKPPRKVYQVTEAGKVALRTQRERVVDKSPHMKDLLTHLILLGNASATDLTDCLQHRRRQTGQRSLELEQRLNRDDRPLGQQLAVSYGLALARAELSWLDDVLAQRADQPHHEEALEHHRA